MPPRKSVGSLQDLTFVASSQLVLQSCRRIEEDVSSDADFDLPFDSDEFKNATQTLRQHLRRFVAPLLWESLFDSVLSEHDKKSTALDVITLYSVFVYEDINPWKFQIPLVKQLGALSPKRFQFWLDYAGMFPNLTELRIAKILTSTYHEIVLAFCQFCTKLQTIVMYDYPTVEMLELLMANCKDLRQIVLRETPFEIHVDVVYVAKHEVMQLVLQECKHLERIGWRICSNFLEKLNTSRKLALKALSINLANSNDVHVIANLCPDLEELDISLASTVNYEEACKKIFQNLASSSLKITRLRLHYVMLIDCDAFDEFLALKGKYITELSMEYCRMSGGRSLLGMLSRCRNLTKFSVRKVNGLKPEHLSTLHSVHQPLFPKLKHLSIDQDTDAVLNVSLTDKIIANSLNVSTLSLILSSEEFNVVDIDEHFARLFSNPMIKHLTKLSLRVSGNVMWQNASPLMCQIIASCPKITELEMPSANTTADVLFPNYAQHLRRVHKKKNIDFKIVS